MFGLKRSWFYLYHNYHHHHYPSRLLAYMAALKLFHPCLSLASLWMVPQLWFMFVITAFTVLRQVVFGRPRFRFHVMSAILFNLVIDWMMRCTTEDRPRRIRWTLFDTLEDLALHVPNPAPCFLVMMVSISSCWHRAKRSCVRFSRVLSSERTTAWQDHARSSASTQIHTEGPTIRSSGRVSA